LSYAQANGTLLPDERQDTRNGKADAGGLITSRCTEGNALTARGHPRKRIKSVKMFRRRANRIVPPLRTGHPPVFPASMSAVEPLSPAWLMFRQINAKL